MNLPEFAANVLEKVNVELQLSLAGLTLDQLLQRPDPQSNNMAWLAWHIARTQDQRSAEASGREQLWTADGWHEKFGMGSDPDETGRGHDDAQVDSVRPAAVEVIATYCSLSHQRAVTWVSGLTTDEIESSVSSPDDGGGMAPVHGVLSRMVHGGLAHVGQLMYVRGLIERRHWFPS